MIGSSNAETDPTVVSTVRAPVVAAVAIMTDRARRGSFAAPRAAAMAGGDVSPLPRKNNAAVPKP